MSNSIPCDGCDGTGKYHEDMTCVRCDGKGVLDVARLDHLQFNYFPRALKNGRISERVFANRIAEINDLRLKLDSPVVDIGGLPIGTGPVLLDSVMCAKYGITLDSTVRDIKAKFPSIFVEEF